MFFFFSVRDNIFYTHNAAEGYAFWRVRQLDDESVVADRIDVVRHQYRFRDKTIQHRTVHYELDFSLVGMFKYVGVSMAGRRRIPKSQISGKAYILGGYILSIPIGLIDEILY